jgi:cyclase
VVKKRVVGVIPVRRGLAVQSFGYRRYLPLGSPSCLAENLDRWGADEIVLHVVDRWAHGHGPDLELIERVARLGLSTPLVYGGGIRTATDATRVVAAGADRVSLDGLLCESPDDVRAISDVIGAQAVIAAVPLRRVDGRLRWWHHRTGQHRPLSRLTAAVGPLAREGVVSELLVADADHDGGAGVFDTTIVEELPDFGLPVIAFGGAADADVCRTLLAHPRVAAIGVGNALAYRETAIQVLRRALVTSDVRPPRFMCSEAGW